MKEILKMMIVEKRSRVDQVDEKKIEDPGSRRIPEVHPEGTAIPGHPGYSSVYTSSARRAISDIVG